MAQLARSLFLALAAGVAGGAAASLLQRKDGGVHPTAKRAVKRGMLLYDRLRGVFRESTETMVGILAMARAEIDAERRGENDAGYEHVVPFETRTTNSERKPHG